MRFNPIHFFRMSRWARNPPSDKRVKLLLAVIAIALAIWGLERIFGTPDWMQMPNTPHGRINR